MTLRPHQIRAQVQSRRGKMAVVTRTWTVGVDAGGTWLRMRATDDRGRRRSIRDAAPAPGELPAALAALCRRFKLRRGNVAHLVVASRGVWTQAERSAAVRRLGGLARRVTVISDAEAAYLGALGDHPGLLILAGTGSIILARDAGGRWRRRGGLGPFFSDHGAAFNIGRRWLMCGAEARARRYATSPDAVTRIAGLAPRVLRFAQRGHREARRITRSESSAVALDLVRLARELRCLPPLRVSWAGRVMGNRYFREQVWRRARREGLRFIVRPPRLSALEAAARLAAPPRSR
jgi:N-acetylglucosamine kinase-like BadF-type ATPase